MAIVSDGASTVKAMTWHGLPRQMGIYRDPWDGSPICRVCALAAEPSARFQGENPLEADWRLKPKSLDPADREVLYEGTLYELLPVDKHRLCEFCVPEPTPIESGVARHELDWFNERAEELRAAIRKAFASRRNDLDRCRALNALKEFRELIDAAADRGIHIAATL